VPTNVTLPYNGLSLDRAGARRADRAWVDEVRASGAALVLWRDRCLTAGGVPVTVPAVADSLFLGLDGTAGVFVTDLSELDEAEALRAAGADTATDVRALFGTLDAQRSATLAYARGLAHWNRNQRFCGACGAATVVRHAGHQRQCERCGKLWFPKIEPAVIMLVTAPDAPRRCLLARHRGAAPNAYSTLAGFVEIGESLEDAVHRELIEEAGVHIGQLRYEASQAWPFPSGIMVGFRAVALSDTIAVDQDELLEARWFTEADVRALLAAHRESGQDRPDSIEAHLIATWLAES